MEKSKQEQPDSSGGTKPQVRSHDKGKGKDTSFQSATDATTARQSMGSRILSSAARLATDLITTPVNAADINKAVPSSKTVDSSVGSSASGRLDFTGDEHAAFSRPSTSSQLQLTGENMFKSSDVDLFAAQQEAAFSSFLDDVPVLKPPTALSPAPGTSNLDITQPFERSECIVSLEFARSTETAGTQFEAAAPVQDGLDVVRLLDSDAYDEVMAADTNGEPSLTTEERKSLRDALFGESQGRTSAISIDWNNLLDFLPSYVAFHDGNAHSAARDERLAHLGTSEAGESQLLWKEQWAQVLTQYTDEVWGDLSSLVQEARREVQAEQSASEAEAVPSEFPALRRLQQILGQIRGC